MEVSYNYNTNLTISGGNVTVAYADGHTALFTYSSGTYVRPAGCFETLAAGPDNTYVLTFKDQTKFTYNANGQLISITDNNGNTLTMTYTNGLLTLAAEPDGRSLSFTYDADKHLTRMVNISPSMLQITHMA